MTALEFPILFRCEGDCLLGILTPADSISDARRPAIVIVVGGPQYRVGSHRQFVIQARAWSKAGYGVLRFDYRGMGDSEGAERTFLEVQSDIRAAIDAVWREVGQPAGVVLFGLCDAVPAILMYAPTDPRVTGLMLANPWVRTTATEARTIIRNYYPKRLMQPSFWQKVLSGGIRPAAVLRGLVRTVRGSRVGGDEGFVHAMLAGWQKFTGRIAVIISGDDLTAGEFTGLCRSSPEWAAAMRKVGVEVVGIPDADHTFSSRRDLDFFLESSVKWLAKVRS